MGSERITLNVPDIKCEGCVQAVKEALTRVAGVRGAEVSLTDKQAHVEIEGRVALKDLIAAVNAAGYKAAPVM